MEFFYIKDGSRLGPFSSDELKNQNIKKETLVWHEGLKDWTPANKIDILKSTFKVSPPSVPPPPLPKSSSKSVEKKTIERTGRMEEKRKLTYDEIAEKVLPLKSKDQANQNSSSNSKGKKSTNNQTLVSVLVIILIANISVTFYFLRFLIDSPFSNQFGGDYRSLSIGFSEYFAVIIFKAIPVILFIITMFFIVNYLTSKTLILVSKISTFVLGFVFTLLIPITIFELVFFLDFFDSITLGKQQNAITTYSLCLGFIFYIFSGLFIIKNRN